MTVQTDEQNAADMHKRNKAPSEINICASPSRPKVGLHACLATIRHATLLSVKTNVPQSCQIGCNVNADNGLAVAGRLVLSFVKVQQIHPRSIAKVSKFSKPT